MKYKSRYDDPEYQKQVSTQMLATPTHEIACRAITDLRQRIKELETALYSKGSGTPEARFEWLLAQLEQRFPDAKPWASDRVVEVHFLDAIDAAIKDSDELNASKRLIMNMFTGGKLFPGEPK